LFFSLCGLKIAQLRVQMAKRPDGQISRRKRNMHSYTEASRLYRNLGWNVVAPAKPAPESKKPDSIVHNVFGRNKSTGGYNTATAEQMDQWEQMFPDRNCLLKVNEGIIGIDVDQYDKWSEPSKNWIHKRGYDNMLEDILRYGDLPPTYTSTSRGKGQVSRIHFFRVDAGSEFHSAPYDDVEIIQLHHRYAVVWPSIHPETGQQYEWYGPDGETSAAPRPSDISDLPREWYAPLLNTKSTKRASKGRTGLNRYRAPYPGPASHWLESLDSNPMDFSMSSFLTEFLNRPKAHVGHDELLSLIGRLHRLTFVYGSTGAREVFEVIFQTYMANTNEQDPYTELFNIIRYVAGEEFVPCLQS
jgi:hypothetical protein